MHINIKDSNIFFLYHIQISLTFSEIFSAATVLIRLNYIKSCLILNYIFISHFGKKYIGNLLLLTTTLVFISCIMLHPRAIFSCCSNAGGIMLTVR